MSCKTGVPYEVLYPPDCPVQRLINLVNQEGAQVFRVVFVTGIIEYFLNGLVQVFFCETMKSYLFTNPSIA